MAVVARWVPCRIRPVIAMTTIPLDFCLRSLDRFVDGSAWAGHVEGLLRSRRMRSLRLRQRGKLYKSLLTLSNETHVSIGVMPDSNLVENEIPGGRI